MGMLNLNFIFLWATKNLSLSFFISSTFTLKDFFKSLFFNANNLKIKGRRK